MIGLNYIYYFHLHYESCDRKGFWKKIKEKIKSITEGDKIIEKMESLACQWIYKGHVDSIV